MPDPLNIGRYARSIESGWLGKIVDVDHDYYKMMGYNGLCHVIAGGDIEDHLDKDDLQWFVPEDIRFVKLI